jgi:HK97 family phage prohead protease
MVNMIERLDYSQETNGGVGIEQSDDTPIVLEKDSCATSHQSFKFKESSIDEEGVFSGYASVFNNVDLDGDVIIPGAFAKSLQSGNPIRLLSQHDRKEPIGVIRSAREDEKGLFVEGKLTLEVQKAREIRALLKDGAIDSFSIGFNIRDSEFDRDRGVNIIKEISLGEVSFVTFPANPAATLSVIKSADELETIRDVEKFLRGKGLSRKESAAVISKITKIKQGEPVSIDDKPKGEPLDEEVGKESSDELDSTKEFVERLNSMTTCLKFNNQLKEIENV